MESSAHPQRGATVAELSAAAEAIASYRDRVGALAAGWRGGGSDDDDVSVAIEEAERAIGVAERTVRRAIKLADRR
jgi:hypothetical protein